MCLPAYTSTIYLLVKCTYSIVLNYDLTVQFLLNFFYQPLNKNNDYMII